VKFEIAATWDGLSIPREESVFLEAWIDDEGLQLRVDAPYHGDPAPSLEPGPSPGLWEYEVVEFFLVGEGERYTEVELGPHGHYLVLTLDGIRKVVEEGTLLEFESRIEDQRWTGRATLAPTHLPPGPHRANACAIHGSGPARRYLSAVTLPGPQPDFHRIQLFPSANLSPPAGGETRVASEGPERRVPQEDWRQFAGETEVLSREDIETGRSLNLANRGRDDLERREATPAASGATGGLIIPILVSLLLLGLIVGLGVVGISVIKRQVPTEHPPSALGAGGPGHLAASASRWIAPDRAEATSSRALSKVGGEWESCFASNTIDGDLTTAWCEGKPKDGLGEQIRFSLEAQFVESIRLIPAFGASSAGTEEASDFWRTNNRISVLQLQTFDPKGQLVEEQLAKLADAPSWQTISLQHPAVLGSFVLTLVDVHPSERVPGKLSRSRHSGLSEVQVRVIPSP